VVVKAEVQPITAIQVVLEVVLATMQLLAVLEHQDKEMLVVLKGHLLVLLLAAAALGRLVALEIKLVLAALGVLVVLGCSGLIVRTTLAVAVAVHMPPLVAVAREVLVAVAVLAVVMVVVALVQLIQAAAVVVVLDKVVLRQQVVAVQVALVL
jgi:hypothetical protein